MKTFVAVVFTLLMGPGMGHLYLRQFKRGIALIVASLVCAVVLALHVIKTMAPDINTTDPSQMLQQFSAGNGHFMLYFNIVFAAIWAYAIVDVIRITRTPKEPGPDEIER